MKQRLLLCLLMLMVSVGIVKAAIRITVSEGSGTVTVTLSSTTYNKFSLDNYPWMFLSDETTQLTTVTASGSTVTYTYTPEKNSKGQTLVIKAATANVNYKEEWKDLSIAISGKITSFKADGGPFLDQFVGIDLHDTGLSELEIGYSGSNPNQRYTNYFPNLKTLNVSGNKLKYIPLKVNGKTTIENYTIGKQTPDVTFQGMAGNAKGGVKLDATALNFNGTDNPLQDATDLQIETLYKDGAAVNYAVADENYTSTKKYTFKDGDIFVDGNFTADIQVNDAKYKGAIICGVPVTVSAAEFEVLKAEGDANGKINIGTIKVGDKLKKGQAITVTPEPKDGYKLSGEPKTVGLTKTGSDNDVYHYMVTGDKDIEITASFVADGTTLKYTAPANATITVKTADGKQVYNGASVTVGEKLTVRIKPNQGYTVSMVKDGDTDITSTNISKDPGIFEAEVTVGADGVNITAEVKVVESILTIVYKNADGLWEGADLINATTGERIGGTNEPAVSDNEITYSNVRYGTPLDIVLKLKAGANAIIKSVTINSRDEDFREKADEPGKFIIEDYYMPDTDVRVVVEVSSISDITITPTMEKDASGYYVIYDGQPNPVTYTVSPNNMQGVKIQYARDDENAQPQDNAYTDCGDYVAYFSYEEDETHQIASGSKEVKYRIEPAQVIITEEPTVTIDEDNKYVINGGKAAYMRDGQPIDITNQGEFIPDPNNKEYNEGNDFSLLVTFKPNDAKNLKEANVAVTLDLEGVKKYAVKIDPSSKDILTMWNGNAEIKDDATVLEGTIITFKVKEDPNLEGKYEVYQIDGEGNKVSLNLYTSSTNYGIMIGQDYSDPNATTLIFRVDVADERPTISLGATCDTEEERKQTVTYDGSVQAYDPLKLVLLDPDTKGEIPNEDEQAWTWTISYSLNGQTVAEPTNAGEYTVTLNREATGHYQAFSTTATLIIEKADLVEAGITVPTPTASRVNVGQPLYYSGLTGSADIAGYYGWGVNTNQEVTESNKTFPVVFYPNNDNYKSLTLESTVTVPVTDEAILVYWSDGNGYLTVKDAGGRQYYSGDAVPENTVLTFTATPYDKFEFESLTIDGQSKSNGATYTFGKGSIEANCTFKPKSTTVIVPEGQYEIDLPEAVRGAMISYVGDPIVDRGEDFTFTVTTLAADANKLRVTAVSENGASQTLTRAANGSYTIADVTEKQTVRISFSSTPTEVKVDIPLVYHEEGHATQGEVSIINNTSGDGKYFYGDELTLIAFPESGVTFEGWSDKSKQQVRELTLTGNVSLRALFSGSPTGIEDIEAARIVAGDGYIQVKNVANANVTVVSMTGRIQTQQRISGDAQIRVPAGIYVVILENGQDVKRTKVIVR